MNENYKTSEQHLEELFKQDMTELVGGFLEYKHLYDEDPEVIVKKISLYIRYLSKNDKTLKTYNKALDIYDAFNFDLLFGEYTYSKKIKTSTIYRDTLIKYFEKYKNVKKDQVLGLAFEKQINEIPVKELEIKCKKQNVTTKEIIFFLKTITFKIIDSKNKNDYCTLYRNYFLKTKSKKDYKRFTGRVIGNHKIAHITKLLEKYDLIVIYPTYMKANKYRLGVANAYHRMARNKAWLSPN